jgi:DNA polymerase-1
MSAVTLTVPRLEADDIMGIAQTNGKTPDTVIVSVDKDMRQIPGWHLNPHKEDFPVFVTEAEADWLFHMQWLSGDQTDGYGGIKGIGPKKAEKILILAADNHPPLSLTEAVIEAYGEKNYTMEQCYGQARCARILRASDWDSEARLPIPWEPEETGVNG